MKILLLFTFLGIVYSCSSDSTGKQAENNSKENSNSVKVQKIIEPIKRGEKIKLLAIEEHSCFDLLFDTISSIEFKKYFRKEHQSKIKIRNTSKVIDIQTAAQTHQLFHYNPNSNQTGDRGYQLLNYFPETKLYALNHNFVSDDFGFSQLVLIDSVTDFQYEIETNSDESFEVPVFSTNNSYFALFRNHLFDDNGTTIAIINVRDKEKPKSYLTVNSVYTTNDFNIESIYWKNDHTLYLKCFRIIEIEDEIKKDIFYLKTKII